MGSPCPAFVFKSFDHCDLLEYELIQEENSDSHGSAPFSCRGHNCTDAVIRLSRRRPNMETVGKPCETVGKRWAHNSEKGLPTLVPKGREWLGELTCCHGGASDSDYCVVFASIARVGPINKKNVSTFPTAVTVLTGHKRQTVGAITELVHRAFSNAALARFIMIKLTGVYAILNRRSPLPPLAL